MTGDDSGAGAAGEGPPPEVRFLKRLVVALAVIMGGGMMAIVALLWLRLGSAPPLPMPRAMTLPAGETAAAVTVAPDRIVVLTASGAVLSYAPDGTLLSRTMLRPVGPDDQP